MSLFVSPIIDITIALFLSVFLIKNIFFKEKDSKGMKWIAIGGLFLVVEFTFPGDSLITLLNSTISMQMLQQIGIILSLIAFGCIIIGSIKTILELFE